MKKIISLFFAIIFCFCVSIQAFADSEYEELLYDATGLLDADILGDMEQSFRTFEEESGIQFRVDVVTDLEDYDIVDYAALFFDGFEYGHGENHDGILLMLYMNPEEDNLGLLDWCFYWNSDNDTNSQVEEVAYAMYEAAQTELEDDAWAGDLASDQRAFQDVLGVCLKTGWNETGLLEEQSGYILDWANILSAAEADELENTASHISETYSCGVYVITVEDYHVFGTSVEAACEEIAESYQLGTGENHDRIILFLSMKDRDYNLQRYGFGDEALTEYGVQELDNAFLGDFREDNWSKGLQDYLEKTGELLEYAREGKPYDIRDDKEHTAWIAGFAYLLFAFVGCVVAHLTCSNWRDKMETARKATDAREYVLPDDVSFRVRKDRYVRTERTSRRVQSSSSSGRSGGTRNSTSSRGSSNHSGKF